MASKSLQTYRQRKAKDQPNKDNMKKNRERTMQNLQIVNRLEREYRGAQK